MLVDPAERFLAPTLLAGTGSRAAMRVAVNQAFMREGSWLADFARPPFKLAWRGDTAKPSLQRLLWPR